MAMIVDHEDGAEAEKVNEENLFW